jgi:hypothetical protein
VVYKKRQKRQLVNMTNEEWIEELYMLSAQIGKYNSMHDKVDECRKRHPDLSNTECAELAYIELKRQHEEETELYEQSISN